MELIKSKLHTVYVFSKSFVKWLFIAAITGACGGLVGSVFHMSVEAVTGVRESHSWLLYLLPLGGLATVFLYHFGHGHESEGTNYVISSVRKKDEHISTFLAPLIFVCTVITHLFGGSAGREGAALQLGGSIGTQVGRVLRLDEKDMGIITMCGMTSVFSALFGTPLTAVFFALEVISVGVIYYIGLVPCIVSALTALKIARLFNLADVKYTLKLIPDFSFASLAKVGMISVLCAVLCIIFCKALKLSAHFFSNVIHNEYLAILIGAVAIIVLTLIVGNRDYNGAGMNIVELAIESGKANPVAFVLKLLFTIITIGSGFKGGEIIPTFFIGSTFGCLIASLMGINTGFGAAIGLVALFCGVTNCPISAIILSIELFGSEGIIYFAICCAVSYMLSGYTGLYTSQKIIYSKTKSEYINEQVH